MSTPSDSHQKAGDAAPEMAPDRQRLMVHQAAELAWHTRHQAGVVAGAPTDLFERVRIAQSVGPEECGGALATETGGALRADAGRVVVGGAAPEVAGLIGGAPPLAQPFRQADVVRVHVRDQYAQDRQALQFLPEDLLPLGSGLVVGDTGVDHCPAFAPVQLVAQQPEVDVVQRKGQGHADPLHTGRDLDAAARLGQAVAQGVEQAGFELVAGGWGHAGCFR